MGIGFDSVCVEVGPGFVQTRAHWNDHQTRDGSWSSNEKLQFLLRKNTSKCIHLLWCKIACLSKCDL